MDNIIHEMWKNTIKRKLIPVIICLVIAAFLIWVETDNYKRLKAGVKQLEELEIDQLEDYVVHVDTNFALDCFAEYGDADTVTGDITKVDYYYYIIYYKDNKYIAVAVNPKEAVFLDEICDNTWDNVVGDTDNYEKSYALEGSVTKMSSDIEKYYIEWFEEMGWSEEEIAECAVPYVLHNGWNTDPSGVIFSWVLAVILMGVSSFILIRALIGGYQRQIKKDFARLGAYADTIVSQDYANAFIVSKRARIGRIFTYDGSQSKGRAYLNREIVWVYRTEAGSSNQVVLWDIQGKRYAIKAKRRECIQALSFYEAQFPHMVSGYSENLRQMFFKDKARFLALRYNDAIRNEDTYEHDQYQVHNDPSQ